MQPLGNILRAMYIVCKLHSTGESLVKIPFKWYIKKGGGGVGGGGGEVCHIFNFLIFYMWSPMRTNL